MSFRIQSPLPEGTESSQFPSSPLPESIGRCLSLSRKQGHIEKAFHTLNELRSDGILCDVTLAVSNIRILAHRVVLAACSPYFNAMFTADLLESKESVITLKGVDGLALQSLINFMYTTDINITEENVQTILPAAQIIQLDDVLEACSAFLQSQLHPSNALGIRSFADLHNCRDLLLQAQAYIDQHFEEVCQCDEFLTLSPSQVCRIISSDNVIVSSEEQVFEAAVRWTKHDLIKRRECFGSLMESIRLPLISQDYLVNNIGEDQLIKSSSQCKDYLIEAMRYHLMKDEQRSNFRSPRVKPRIPLGSPKAMLVFGGQAPKAIRSVEQYDFAQDVWIPMVDMPSRRCRCGTAVLDGIVYAVGGFNGSLRVRTVECFDPIKHIWSQVTNMEARRSTLGTGVLNGLIFAVGGFDGTLGLNSVEFYEPESREWHMVSCMSTRRSSVGVGVLGNFLYAVGGYDGVSRQCLSTIEYYNPVTNVWHAAPEMSCRRSGAGVGVLDGQMYAVGGHDGPLIRSTVEVFNSQMNTWRPVATMNVCRRNAGVVMHNGLLYVLGGDDGTASLNSVECYDPRIDKWTLLPKAMIVGRSYAGVCVVDKMR